MHKVVIESYAPRMDRDMIFVRVEFTIRDKDDNVLDYQSGTAAGPDLLIAMREARALVNRRVERWSWRNHKSNQSA